MDLIRYRELEEANGRVISELVPNLSDEVKLLSRNHLAGGKRSDMMDLKSELENLRDFVQNAEPKSEEDNVWLAQLMEAAELLEHLHRASQQNKWTSFLLKAAQFICVSTTTNLQIQNITALLRAINESGQVYKQLSYENVDIKFKIKIKIKIKIKVALSIQAAALDFIQSHYKAVPVIKKYRALRFDEIVSHFDRLPYNLKLCVLYFGMLPEDFIIPNEELVKLWIAEGFIEEKYGGETMKQVAEKYFNKLVLEGFVIDRKGFSQAGDYIFDFTRKMCEEVNFRSYLSISRQESSFRRYLSISDLLQDRLQGSVQSTSNVFWCNLQLSFSRTDEVVDFVPRWSSSSNRCISDDHVNSTVSRCSSSSNRYISEDDYDI